MCCWFGSGLEHPGEIGHRRVIFERAAVGAPAHDRHAALVQAAGPNRGIAVVDDRAAGQEALDRGESTKIAERAECRA